MTTQIRKVLSHKGWAVTTVPPEMPLDRLAELLVSQRIGGAPVVAPDGRVVGMVSERDIVIALAVQGTRIGELDAAAVMTWPAVTASPDDTLVEAMRLMTLHRVRHIPIVEAGRLVGLLSIGDVVKHRLGDAEMEADTLRAYITQSGSERVGSGYAVS